MHIYVIVARSTSDQHAREISYPQELTLMCCHLFKSDNLMNWFNTPFHAFNDFED